MRHSPGPHLQDDRRLTEASIPTLVLSGLVDYAQARGVAAEAWFAGLGLSVAQIQHPETLVSFRQAATVLRRALRALPPEAVGLQMGSREGLASFGMLGLAMMSCRTVRDAFETGFRYHLASGSLMDVAPELSATEVALRAYERFPEPALLPFLCEEMFSSTTALIRAMIGNEVGPRRVELSYPAPAYAAAYQRLFNCPVHFDCEANRLAFDAALLDRPLASYSPANFAAALAACRRLIEAPATSQDVVTAVENLLRENLRQRSSMAGIAGELNITERTLRRQLAEAGQRFSDIRDRILEQRARILLRESPLTVSAIAAELGFGDLRDFRRAFRRWTGQTPLDLRRQKNATATAEGGNE
jgi:AraC-like DNA-binding protein